MPLIQVTMFAGRSKEQKREFVELLTRETCRILKTEPAHVDIIFSEVKKEDWGHGGKLSSET